MGFSNLEDIREFLNLPPEALPNAQFLDSEEGGDPWDHLRRFAVAEPWPCPVPDWARIGIRLQADRPEWSRGRYVFVSTAE